MLLMPSIYIFTCAINHRNTILAIAELATTSKHLSSEYCTPMLVSVARDFLR